MNQFPKYASVILDLSIDKMFDYGLSQEQLPFAKRGCRVEVPVRGRKTTGYIYEVKEKPAFDKVLPIAKVSEEEVITENLFELALWMAKYYCAPLNKVLQVILPATVRNETKPKMQLFVMRGKTKDELAQLCESMRSKAPSQAAIIDVMLTAKKGMLLTELLEKSKGSRAAVDALADKGLLVLDIVRIDRSPLVNENYFQTKPKKLNDEQSAALSKIISSLEKETFETHLLYGVTGSGKTEVYLQAIEKALTLGKGTIMLVPEISLTAQTVERFRSRFEGKIAILHHRLSQGERLDEWQRIQRGEAVIVIGARSAVFSPVKNLGLIIVDEEHDSSFKQTDEAPCYHAREIAVMRGKLEKGTIILGSATPSLETYYNALKGKYTLSPLLLRADAAHLPQFLLVDMGKEYEKAKGYTNFSEALLEGIKKRMALGEQTILFLNRRGYHTMLICNDCKKAIKCQHCDVSLTFHKGENTLACHLCNYSVSPPPRACPECKSPDCMKFRGVGTEQVEKALHAILPEVRTIRVDADTTKHKGSHQRLLRDFATGKADVLLGTQMIAKGLHFPQVTLVGVLNADASLNIPDFRASESVFQLITQVAGRAGRGAIAGEVIVQSTLLENSTIQLAAAQNYLQFYEEEMAVRQLFEYPPLSHLVKLAFSGEDENMTKQTAEAVRREMGKLLTSAYALNPVVPAGHAKVKDKYRLHFIVKGPQIYPINRAIVEVKEKLKISDKVRLLIDVNPLSTFF